MRCRQLALGSALLLAASTAIILVGPEVVAGQTAQATPSGSDLFYNNCAACHGRGAKGDGPLGQVLTIRPADLTLLARTSGGIYPADKIYQLIDGRDPMVKGHGGPDMPVWGEVFSATGDAASVKARIDALVKYIETLQVR